jgi:hypothetical protein
MYKYKSLVGTFACAAIVLAFASPATAGAVYYFDRITNNASQNVAGQLSVEVVDSSDPDVGPNQVGFIFRNNVGFRSSISEIYFDDGTLIDVPTIYNNGTAFDIGADPGNLPSWQTLNPVFEATEQFSADAVGNPDKGVNAAGESVKLVFNLINGSTYSDTLSGLNDGLTLRIGLHLRDLDEDGQESDSFVNITPVPLPAAAWMGMTLLGSVGGAGYFRRRQQRALV